METVLHIQPVRSKRGKKPVHAGVILKEVYLAPYGISNTELAKNIGKTRRTVSMLVNGRSGVSAEMALCLAKAFNTTPEWWLTMQLRYDLWVAGKKVKLNRIKSYVEVVREPVLKKKKNAIADNDQKLVFS